MLTEDQVDALVELAHDLLYEIDLDNPVVEDTLTGETILLPEPIITILRDMKEVVDGNEEEQEQE